MQRHCSPKSVRAYLAASAAGTALLVGVTGAANAQTAPSNGASNEVAAIIVTAQRRSENLQNVPVSVVALSSKDIQGLGVKETEDIAQLTPNVVIVTNQGAGNQPLITIRGIGLNDFDTNNAGPNGVYVDDVYISAPAAQSFSVFDLNQVQVLKGPQGTLYGRNTSGGAVLFTSNGPTDYYTGDLHLEVGNFNTVNVSGAIGGPITDNLEGRIAGVYNHSDGFMHNTLSDGPASGNDSEAARLQLLYKPNDKLKIAFSTSIGYVHNLPQEYRHIGTLKPGTQGNASPQICSVAEAYAGKCVDTFGYGTPSGYYDGSWSRTEKLSNLSMVDILKVDYSLGKINLTSISSFQYNDKYFPEDTDAGPDNLIQASYKVRSHTYTQEFRAAESTDRFNWQGGLYYLHEDLSQNQPLYLFINGDTYGGLGFSPGAGHFDGVAQRSFDSSRQTTDSTALFGQGDYTFGKLTLTLGGRFTYERKTFDYDGSTQFQSGGTGNFGPLTDIISVHGLSQSASNFTWRTALNYHFTRGVMGYASVATGFKSGDFNGSFLSNDYATALAQLKPVLPEHVTAYEVGVKSSLFDRRVTLDVAAFYNDYKDEQIFAQQSVLLQTADGGTISEIVNRLINAERAHTEGVEVDLKAVPVHGLTLEMQPAWLLTRLDHAGHGVTGFDGNQLAAAPKFSLTATAEYRYPVFNDDNIDIRWMSAFKSHEFYDSTNDPYLAQDAYWVHNLNLTYQSHKGWEAGIYVRNVTGTRYATNASDLTSPFGMLEVVLGAPRTYGVSLNYHF